MVKAKKNLMGIAKLKPHLLNLFVDGNIILKLVLKKWRKLHNKELHDLYSSPSIIRIISRGG
jgi:hypothetical protein